MMTRPGRVLSTEHVPEDSPFWSENDRGKDHWLRADKVAADPPVQLQRWLDNRGFDYIPERTSHKYAIGRRLKKMGLQDASEVWRADARKEIGAIRSQVLSPPIVREITWRLVEMAMSDYNPEVKLERSKILPQEKDAPVELEAPEGMEFLPDWMRWAVMHPGLLLTDESLKQDPVVQNAVDKYLAAYPCPHQAAMTQYNVYRGDHKGIKELFKEIGRLHLAAVRTAAVADVTDEGTESAETKSIMTLESILGVYTSEDT